MLPFVSSALAAYTMAPRCASVPAASLRSGLAARMVATAPAASLRPDIAAELGNEPTAGMADEEALLAKNAFVIPPEELLALAKAFTAAQLAGTADGSNGGADWFAPDFRFVAPGVARPPTLPSARRTCSLAHCRARHRGQWSVRSTRASSSIPSSRST